MTSITKEWLQKTITSIESARDEIPFGLEEDQNNMLTAFKIALASLEAKPVAWTDDEELRDVKQYGFGEIFQCPPDKYADPRRVISLYREPPAVPAVLERLRAIVSDPRALPRRKEWVSGQQYSYVLLENVEAMVDEACHAAMLQGSQPVSQTYNLPELIEGMEVSIDVSTCDADLGNRYFGTVTEALELDTAKNGYILLVQDAEPNFDVNGNSPGTPDSWISCSDRMPEKGQNVLISVNFDSSLVEPIICSARYTGSTFRRGDATIKPGNGIEQATHWMPLPEPPQEVK